MAQKALLFIPDISGFTEFVNHTDINHSRHIISELLELLIDANNMQLELAEVEGDALFWYKLVDHADLSELEQQIEQMYLAFHTHLKRYEYQRICNCGACASAYNLKLKFVAHFGEIEFIDVKDTTKPYGKNVIIVHRILKNDIPLSEYALYTQELAEALTNNTLTSITSNYDFGTLTYSYRSLDTLKQKLPQIKPIPDNVPKHKVFDRTYTINAPVIDLYEVISNFDYRLLWTKGIDRLEYEKNKVNRSGLKHQCLINNKKVDQTTVKKEVEKGQLVYGESTKEIPLTTLTNVYYILEEHDALRTKLHIEVYVDFKPFGFILKPLMKKNFKKIISANINELNLLIDSGFALESNQ